MIRGVLARATAFAAIAPFLTFASALAPTHLHQPGHGHEHAVAHSHFAPHHVEAHHAGEGAEIEHDDEAVVWIDSPILHEAIGTQQPIPTVATVELETVTVTCRWSVTPFDAAAPAHGPPKPGPLFRGPPPSLSELL